MDSPTPSRYQIYYRNNIEWLKTAKKAAYEKNRKAICKAAQLRRQENPEKTRAIKLKSVRKHAAHYNAKNSLRLAAMRSAAISVLGGKCVTSGYEKDSRAIQIDHINGGGTAERKKVHNFALYRSIVLLGHQGKYQALCANCNFIKRMDLGEHPKGCGQT